MILLFNDFFFLERRFYLLDSEIYVFLLAYLGCHENEEMLKSKLRISVSLFTLRMDI